MMATVGPIESFSANDDIFDAEVDDESDGGQQDEELADKTDNNEIENGTKDDIFDDEGGSPQEPEGNNSSDDSGDDMTANGELSPGDKKSKKKSRSPKPRKMKKAAIKSIHSECQRMMRDAHVKVPYYTPAVKDITHFLTRVPVNLPSLDKKESKATIEKAKTDAASDNKEDTTAPKLSDANDPFFCDETPTDNLPVKGVRKLMERFEKHTKKPVLAKKKDILVVLDDDSNDKSSQVISQRIPDKPKPGGTLQALKEKLEVKMKLQRQELRKVHETQRKLDNEEISGDEEEEAEFSDESDSDYELDKWNAEDERVQEEETEGDKDAQNEFIDNEADEDGSSGSDGDISDDGSDENDSVFSSKNTKHHRRHKTSKKSASKSLVKAFDGSSNSQSFSEEWHENTNGADNGPSLCLRLDSLEDDDELTSDFTKMKSYKSTDESLQLVSDHTNDSSNIQPAQVSGKRHFSHLESDSEISSMLPPISKSNVKDYSHNRQKKKLSQLTLPIEDSQELFDTESHDEEPQDKISVSNGFSFHVDDESQMTQMLDTQGFLFSTKKQKRSKETKDQSQSSDNMSEILGLCSGQFTGFETKPDTVAKKPKSLLGTLINDENSQNSNMDELLGLCSGMFSSKADNSQNEAKESRDEEQDFELLDNDELEDDKNGQEGTGNEADEACDKDLESIDKEDDIQEDEERSEDENESDAEKLVIKKKKKTKKIFDKKKFYEEEAELSGSDVGSDEDEDIDTDDDILEEDSDQEELPSDEELQNQINRVHMKTILDEDKAELRLMQDIYLQDGDLHGEGRKRNFRWRGIDFNSQGDLFGNKLWNDDDDNNSNVELMTEEESKKRKERFERDTYIREEMQKGSTNSEITDIDENSQVILNIIKDTSNAAPAASPTVVDKPAPIACKKPIAPAPRRQRIPSQKGSFLNRSKATLNRLSSITANNPNSSSSGRSFVFKSVGDKNNSENSKQKMPRTTSMIEPTAKRPKLDRSLSDNSSNSIFSMF